MSSVRWCGTADVANPRPREVGGACRRQVLAGARTQETVGGPNGAQRSEFRRTAPPDNNDIVLSQCFPAMSYVSVVGRACMALTMLQGHLTWQRMHFTWWFCYTKFHRCICMTMSRIQPAEFCNHLAGTNFGRRDDATAPSVTH